MRQPNAVCTHAWMTTILIAGFAVDDASAQPVRSAVFSMNVDGSDVVKISHQDKWWLGNVAVSHEGSKLAYTGTETRRDWGRERIFVEEIGTESPVDLGFGDAPDWSPDDHEIVFFLGDRNPESQKPGVYTMRADGTRREWICEGTRPRWSPDGKTFVVVSRHEGFPSLYLVDALTLKQKRILAPAYRSIVGASWSPDSKGLVYVGHKGDWPPGIGQGELAVVDAAADQLPRVLANGQLGWHPDWSPDGKQVLFWFSIKGQERLQLLDMKPPHKAQAIAGQTTARNSDAVWFPDGKKIAFLSDRLP